MSSPEHRSVPEFMLKQGEICCTIQPCIVTTILGSCVSITLFHPPTRTAAICHAVLSEPRAGTLHQATLKNPYWFVNMAVPFMFSFFEKRHIPVSSLEAKLFGGGDMTGESIERPPAYRVGDNNVQEALRQLELRGLQPKRSSVGGNRGMKVLFNTGTGRVLLKRLPRMEAFTSHEHR